MMMMMALEQASQGNSQKAERQGAERKDTGRRKEQEQETVTMAWMYAQYLKNTRGGDHQGNPPKALTVFTLVFLSSLYLTYSGAAVTGAGEPVNTLQTRYGSKTVEKLS